MDAETIARSLTKAQREAVRDAFLVALANYPVRWEVRAPRVWKALIDKGLAFPAAPIVSSVRRKADRAVLNATGLQVKEILERGE